MDPTASPPHPQPDGTPTAPEHPQKPQQNILTLGLELEFLLLGFEQDENPYTLVTDALDAGIMVPFECASCLTLGTSQASFGVCELPELRSSVRRGFVPWLPPGRFSGAVGGIRRYDRKRFNVMDEEGIDDQEVLLGLGLFGCGLEQLVDFPFEEETRGLGSGGVTGGGRLSEMSLGMSLGIVSERRQPLTARQLLFLSHDTCLVDLTQPVDLRLGEMFGSGSEEPEGGSWVLPSETSLEDIPDFESLPEPLFSVKSEGSPGLSELLHEASTDGSTPESAPSNIIAGQPLWHSPGTPEIKKCGRASLEISTPILRERSWQRVIVKMLNSLTALEQRPQGQPLKIQFNQSTGLHVHVGRRGGWSIHQLKKILKAIVIFEEAMDLMHPDSRHSSATSEYAQSDMFRSNVRHMQIHNRSRLERVEWIDLKINSCNSRTRDEGLSTLCNVVNGRIKSIKYNFLGVLSCGTVEFRQAVGTLDVAAVEGWVNTILNFVHAAINTSQAQWCRWAKGEDEAIKDGDDSTLTEFLDYGQHWRNQSPSYGPQGVDLEDELPAFSTVLHTTSEDLEKLESVEFYDSDFSVEEYLPGNHQQSEAA